ncbi:MAG: hypothetical protein JNK87_00585 [Bryobacterales bacterium]|nr:hypothetical protein [Bryobacterales bacterium]
MASRIRGSRTQGKGTPQGGVISPLLSNLYLHWFDKQFHRNAGPAHGANARLVRYADDFVVLARYQADKLRNWIESTLEGWLGLQINRDKTRVVNLWQTGAKLDFLGYTFCHWAGTRNCLRMPATNVFHQSRMPGNPLVRFEEGRVTLYGTPSYSTARISERVPPLQMCGAPVTRHPAPAVNVP